MRTLLAVDGSISSNLARELVAGLAWPAGSVIRVVGVIQRSSELFGLSWMPVVPENAESIEADLVGYRRDTLEAAERSLAAALPDQVTVDHVLLRGHAARAIIDGAIEFGADLVVVGSRGHGRFETALLGSTSAEVVDHAPCPVLVAREPHVGSIVLAEDGSTGAAGAAALLDAWSILASQPVTVVSVAEIGLPWAVPAPSVYGQTAESAFQSTDEVHRQLGEIADRRAAQLAKSGRSVETQVRDGDPAAEIVATAAGLGADLIVIGTRGHTGLTRMILGSVARKVLTHAPCSVLVVREGVARRSQKTTAEEKVAAGTAV